MDPYLINSAGGTAPESDGGTTTVVANPPKPPTTNTVPNTTTNTKKTVYQTAAKDSAVRPASDPSQFPAYDNEGNLQPGFKINEENNQPYYAGVGPSTKDTPVQPASDPSQFPQYDDDGNLMPGFKINQENGQPYYAGVGPATSKAAVDTNNGGEGFGLGTSDGNGGFVNAQGDPVDSNGMPIAGVPPTTYSSPVNNPYYGLTPTQLQDLGGADPTDPYIRARLGIPQLLDSTLIATSGFGFGNLNTGLPSIDNALGTIKGLFGGLLGGGTGGGSGLSSLFTNFSATVGGLFGAKPTASTTAATTGSGTAALVAPVTGPPTSNTAVDTNNGGEGFGLGTPDGNGGFVNAQGDPVDSVGMPIAGVPPTTYSGTTLDADQADAFYNGTGTLTADQRTAQDQQTAADAAALYPGTNNTNLKNIDAANGAIARNEVGISNAEQIIAENNAELADANISDARRAELEANNASQENYIRLANDNTAEQELVIEANADGYAAGGGNPDSGQGPGQVAALVDPGLQPDFVTDAEQIATRDRIAVGQAQDFNTNEDPFETSRLEAEQNLANQQPADTNLDVDPLTDNELAVQEAFQQDQRDQLASENFVEFPPPVDVNNSGEGFGNVFPDGFGGFVNGDGQPVDANGSLIPTGDNVTESAALVDVNNSGEGFGNVFPDGFGGFVNGDGQPVDANGSLIPTGDNLTQSAALVDPGTGGEGFDVKPDPEGSGGFVDSSGNPVDQFGMPIEAVQPTSYPPDAVDPLSTGYTSDAEQIASQNLFQGANDAVSEEAAQSAAIVRRAKQQSTIQARYKQPGNTDWRVRLSLGPKAQYLYNANDPGILAPLKAGSGTDGVIFPYTPNITTTYSANYEQYDLVHSNYRGLFYKNSRVGDIQIRGTFTAQNTTEANYLLAVIHFFRSATKMFYGQDPERGTPPPICLLNGFGGYQFSDHPVVISSFNYTLPNDVDYIRTTNPNNFGLNLNNRYNPSGASLPAGGSLSGLTRLANALLTKGAQAPPPSPNSVAGSVQNLVPSSYVPTKMEIDITLIPAQTRAQISKQFSLAGFANGDLLKGGFW